MDEKNEKIEVELFSSTNEYEINQVCGILEENNIPFIRIDDGSGSYMNIYMGFSVQEKRILVNTDAYDKAIELISPFLLNDVSEEDISELNEEDNDGKPYITIRRYLGFFILGLPIFIIILIIIATILS